MKTRAQIKKRAKKAVAKQRGTAIGLSLLYIVAASTSGTIDYIFLLIFGRIAYWIIFFVGLLILFVMLVNIYGEHIKIYRGKKADASAIFSGLGINFFRKLGSWFWVLLWTTLWSFLLVVPGIVKSLAYTWVQYIIAEFPTVTTRQAMKISMKISKGHKGKIFVFGLSWIGWLILSMLTCGILYIFYVGPYMYTAYAGFYIELRRLALKEGKITYEELGIRPPKR